MRFRRRRSSSHQCTGSLPLKRRALSLLLEGLEDRTAPAVFNVTGFADGAGMVTQTGPGVFNATTLRAAVTAADASADAANTINLPAGTYALTLSPSQLNLTNNMTIQGASDTTTIIDAGQNGRAFFIQMGTILPTVNLDGLTIQNGKAPLGDVSGVSNAFGGGIVNEATLNLNNVIVAGNLAQGANVNGASAGAAYGGGIYSTGTLVIQNSTISNNMAIGGNANGTGFVFGGRAVGGGIDNNASNMNTFTLTNSTISGNVATGGNGTSTNNYTSEGATGRGGGVASQYSPASLINVTFTNNQANGGIGYGSFAGAGGFASGGALYDRSYSALTIQSSYFSGNKATGGSGANPAGITSPGNVSSRGGRATGGAIFNTGGDPVSISGTTLAGNIATGGASSGGDHAPRGGAGAGGGLYDGGGEGAGKALTVTASTLSGNSAIGGKGTQTNAQEGFGGAAYGGGIDARNYTTNITDTTFSANSVQGGDGTGDYGGAGGTAKGGGMLTLNGQVTIQDSTFSGNTSFGGNGSNTTTYTSATNYSVKGGNANGAGISFLSTNLSISNTTLYANHAVGGNGTSFGPAGFGNGGGGYGGGIYGGYGNSTQALLLTNSTLDFNQARGGTGGSANLNGTGAGGGVYITIKKPLSATLASTIVANDAVFGGFGPDVFGSFVSNGFNLIGSIDATAQGFTNGTNNDQVGTAAAPINPLLGSLTNNGGSTQTQDLGLGSPAVGKGANPNTLANDQRGVGFPRTVNGSTDVGAFQSQPTQISGFVYNDANDNGVFDQGEKGIAGVTVTLTGLDFNSRPVSMTVVTQADGSFLFPNLKPASEGGYTLTETPPAGFLDGQASVPTGQTGTVQSPHIIKFIALQFGFTLANYDFGQIVPSSLGGFVFIDANKNGKFDPGEPGFANATVTLTGTDDHMQAVNIPVQTSAAGAYDFGNLRPGTYTITLTPPGGNFMRGANIQGTPGNGTVAANSFNNIIIAVPGVMGANNDFAEIQRITANGVAVSATEGRQFTLPVATFTDADGDPLRNFTATVNWGDGTNSPGTIVAGAAGFTVNGTHTYLEKGIYPIVVTINDTDTSSSMAETMATVADAALTLQSLSFSAFEGLQKNNLVVATFTDAGGLKPVTEYTATINWGDGTAVTNGRIVLAGNMLQVVGDHKYAVEGFFTVTTTVIDVGGQTPGIANATATSSLQILVGGYVTSLYSALLNRLPDAPGLAGWLQALQNGTTRAQVGTVFFESSEHLGIEVDQLYGLILHRPSDPAGRAMWVADLLAGMSENEVAIQFVTSPEYTASHSSIPAYVNGLYNDILGRAADSQGFSYWTQILQNNARTRAAVAYYFLSTGEALTDAITSYYQDFLNRAPDPAGLQGFLQELESGKSSTADIVGQILGSPEYLNVITAKAM